MMEDLGNEVIISHVTIGDGVVEVGFLESRDQSQNAGLVKTLVIDRNRFSALVEEIHELAVDLVDAALLEIRNPAESLDPRRRLSAPREAPSAD